MVKTQLRIDDDLHRKVTAAAAAHRRSLNGELLWLIARGLVTEDIQPADEEPEQASA